MKKKTVHDSEAASRPFLGDKNLASQFRRYLLHVNRLPLHALLSLHLGPMVTIQFTILNNKLFWIASFTCALHKPAYLPLSGCLQAVSMLHASPQRVELFKLCVMADQHLLLAGDTSVCLEGTPSHFLFRYLSTVFLYAYPDTHALCV